MRGRHTRIVGAVATRRCVQLRETLCMWVFVLCRGFAALCLGSGTSGVDKGVLLRVVFNRA